MDSSQTTAAVQRYLDDLAGVSVGGPSEAVVRALLGRSVNRLHLLCARLLYKQYPRLTRGPVNLQADELLGAVVDRLIRAMRQVRPRTVREFFALANQHVRWELNEVARQLDRGAMAVELRDSRFASPTPIDPSLSGTGTSGADSTVTSTASRVLGALEGLPDDEREVFNLVRLQGMTQAEAAVVIGCATKTIQRRLNRGLLLLSEQLRDLVPTEALAESVADGGEPSVGHA